VFYTTAAGTNLIEKELDDLTRAQKAAVQVAMENYATDRHLPGQLRPLGGGLQELRIQVERCAIRLHFGLEREQGVRVALALQVVNKKSQRARPQDLELSRERWADWKRRR
jgi:phage-related protein